MCFNREMNYQYRIPCSYGEKKKKRKREGERQRGKKMERKIGEGNKTTKKTKPDRKCVLLMWI